MKTIVLTSVMMLLVSVLFSCADDSEGNGKLTVRLTDAPSAYDKVLIDIQEIQIHVSANETSDGWQTLELLNPGVYNLLDFTNGLDTLLVEATLPAGNISQMRMVLGDNNQVMVNGDYFDLATPSAQQSGLKFSINAYIQEGIDYRLWIDFDAAKSIVEKGNGSYSLKPVIRTFTEATSGAIKGVVSPIAAKPAILAINNANDTISTYADAETGAFLFRGLTAGSYTVVFDPADGYLEKEMEDVAVSLGVQTDLGTVAIEPIN